MLTLFLLRKVGTQVDNLLLSKQLSQLIKTLGLGTVRIAPGQETNTLGSLAAFGLLPVVSSIVLRRPAAPDMIAIRSPTFLLALIALPNLLTRLPSGELARLLQIRYMASATGLPPLLPDL